MKLTLFLGEPRKGRSDLSEFTPIEVQVNDKDFWYYSMKKVDNFGLPTENKGGSLTVAGSGGSRASSKKSERERLADLGNFLLRNDLLYTQEVPTVGKYLLIRTNAMFGNMWRFGVADDDPIRNVVWWVGFEDQNIRVFAYGDRRNFRKQGGMPDRNAYKGTWWPSDYGADSNILASIAASVEGEGVSNFDNSKARELLGYCFNDGVIRGCGLKGSWDILMHVHHIEFRKGEAPFVCGSPIWVAMN